MIRPSRANSPARIIDDDNPVDEESDTMRIVFIHGDLATEKSCSYFRTQLGCHNHIFLEHDNDNGIYRDHKEMLHKLARDLLERIKWLRCIHAHGEQ
jgi:hypothetical protein